jgi:antitoxin HicB
MNYPFNVVKDSTGFLVTFPDIPEAATAGATEEEAMEMASDCLLSALEIYFEGRRAIPVPGLVKTNYVVELAPSMALKISLVNEMHAQGITRQELANRLNMKPQQVSRMLGSGHLITNVDVIAQCFRVLGCEFKGLLVKGSK